MPNPDRTGDDEVDETTAVDADRQQTERDDAGLAAPNPADSHPADPPDLPDNWVPA